LALFGVPGCLDFDGHVDHATVAKPLIHINLRCIL